MLVGVGFFVLNSTFAGIKRFGRMGGFGRMKGENGRMIGNFAQNIKSYRTIVYSYQSINTVIPSYS
jgi:hypothetical protein